MEKSFRRAEKTFDIELEEPGNDSETRLDDARALPPEPRQPAPAVEPSSPEVVGQTAEGPAEVVVSQNEAPSDKISSAQSEQPDETFGTIGEEVGKFFRTLQRDAEVFVSDPASAQPVIRQAAAEPLEVPLSKHELPVGQPAVASNGYSIQVFASRSAKITGDYVRELQEDGLQAWMRSPDRFIGDEWYRAMIGRFSTRAEAKESLKDIRRRKELADAFIRQDGERATLKNDADTKSVETKPELVQAKVLGDLDIADGRD
jgi:septal ring-binding cell division protein DamX